MKKLVMLIILILLVSSSLVIILLKQNKEHNENNKEIVDKPIDSLEDEEKYIDDNPIILGLYVKENGNYKLITEYNNVWKRGVDIGVVTVFATNENIISSSEFKTKWWEYWNSYPNIDDYKIGYNIKYTVSDGTTYNRRILCPEDTDMDWGWGELFIYLYDSANATPGVGYSHLTPDKVIENTKYSTIKLTGHDVTKDFLSPIELTVFTYKDNNDFDPITGLYRGNSFYTITINQTK